MKPLRVMVVGESKEKWLTEFCSLYGKKLQHFCKFELIFIKPYKESRQQLQDKLKKEGEQVLKLLQDTDHLILCDLKGKQLSSLKWAEALDKAMSHPGKKRLNFLIGGAFGVSEAVSERADLKLKLSEMTMNHHVALSMLLEQIYRGFSIQQGLPYHNE